MKTCLSLCVLALATAAAQPLTVEQRFTQLRKSPPELYAFLLAMPKGADLHSHLGGAVYAETYMRFAAEEGLCVDAKTFAIIARPTAGCGDNKDAALLRTDNSLAGAVIDSLSMRNFVPGRESGHDHFFAAFAKFGPGRAERTGPILAEVIQRAADENESYLELMALNANAANSAGTAAGFNSDFEATKSKLMASGLPQAVVAMRNQIDQLEKARNQALSCGSQPDSPACRVTVGYICQILRESPPQQAFAQILAATMLASEDPRVVGINMVQPEDGLISMRDYHLQMQMVGYAHKLYPKAHITLHAGELASGLVPPDGLRFHIREAVQIAQAERIGHGVDLAYETGSTDLLAEMKRRRVMVEINLTSNDAILGVRGKDHPLPVYRSHGVPVALSTDDEGVARSHLTQEYLRAALEFGLSYPELKDMVRNSLQYSFASGAGLWRKGDYRVPVEPCATGRKTEACKMFLKENEKARLQADLEDRFATFERAGGGLPAISSQKH
jgi:adenosine deaminase